jgi:hypothetical protein
MRYVLYLKTRCFLVRRRGLALTIGLLFLLFGLSVFYNSARSEELEPVIAARLKTIPFCEAGRQFDVPPELVAGVFLFENLLARGLVDSAQDAIFNFLIDHRDGVWWDRWAVDAMRLADEFEDARLVSNKWPPSVVATGVAFSIGPAQITPRTALRSCRSLQNTPSVCANGTKFLIRQLLSERGAAEAAAMVLHFEQRMQKKETGIDVSGDVGRWATIYNVGGDFYRKTFTGGIDVNRFGRWVSENAEGFRTELRCTK